MKLGEKSPSGHFQCLFPVTQRDNPSPSLVTGRASRSKRRNHFHVLSFSLSAIPRAAEKTLPFPSRTVTKRTTPPYLALMWQASRPITFVELWKALTQLKDKERRGGIVRRELGNLWSFPGWLLQAFRGTNGRCQRKRCWQ